MPTADVVVIGAGLAGLSCAAELAERGARVFVAAKGMATTHWAHGGIDVAAPTGAGTAREGIHALAAVATHPYAMLQGEVDAAVEGHRARLATRGIEMIGSLDAPLVPIPTALGSLRRAAVLPIAQATVLDRWADDGLLLVGIRGYRDAWAAFAARNLRAAGWEEGPRAVRAIEVELPGLAGMRNLNGRSLSILFDDPSWRALALDAIARAVPAGGWRVGLPAILGRIAHRVAHRESEITLGHRVFEMPSLPPSVPGLRLYEALRASLVAAGGRIQVGFDVVEVERQGRRVVAIHTEAAARTLRVAGGSFVLATGGIGGEGIRARPDGTLDERVFGLAVSAPPRDRWFSDDPLVPHPLEAAGVAVDEAMRPIDGAGAPALDNVHVIGSALAGMHYLDERCGDGVALASAHRVAQALAGARASA